MADTDTKDTEESYLFLKGKGRFPISPTVADALAADIVATMRVQRPEPRAE